MGTPDAKPPQPRGRVGIISVSIFIRMPTLSCLYQHARLAVVRDAALTWGASSVSEERKWLHGYVEGF